VSRALDPRPLHALNQAMPVENRVNSALGRDSDVAVKSSHKEVANLARTPMRLVPLGVDDQRFELLRQLVGIPDRPARKVVQRLLAMLFVALEDLVAGLARYGSRSSSSRICDCAGWSLTYCWKKSSCRNVSRAKCAHADELRGNLKKWTRPSSSC
jgi:hypothetical protein